MPSQEELRKELVNESRNISSSSVKTLSEKLKEMGFDERSFMAVKYEAKVADHIEINKEGHSEKKADPYLSFGPEHRHPSANGWTDGELNDQYMGAAIGGIGSNNGIYSAQAKHGREIIITQDREIYNALQRLGFKEDSIGVPMSNGGIFVDDKQQAQFDEMKFVCARKRDLEGQEKRTAAVQRGDIITTYDPNDKDADGIYRNVRHYEKSENGGLRSVSMVEASHKLQSQQQYGANTNESISKGKELDNKVVQQMLANNWVRY